jgi:hypothetical protein
MGRIAVTNGGRIEFSECHIEVNNASNKLTGIPFETASSERAEIVVSGGEIIGFLLLASGCADYFSVWSQYKRD